MTRLSLTHSGISSPMKRLGHGLPAKASSWWPDVSDYASLVTEQSRFEVRDSRFLVWRQTGLSVTTQTLPMLYAQTSLASAAADGSICRAVTGFTRRVQPCGAARD